MRRTVAAVPVLLAVVLLAGCSGDDGPVHLSVTTPPASATAGSAPAPTPDPAPTGSPATVPNSPLAQFQSLVAGWQRARSTFFTAVSSGRPLTVAQQRALASTFLAAQRKFYAQLLAGGWPAVAQPAVSLLLGRNRGQQAGLVAMAAATSKGEFTARLGEYGVNTGPENQAVAAVVTALG
jgi:hypothetical protein